MAMLYIYDHTSDTFSCTQRPPGVPLEERALWQGHMAHPAWTDARLLAAYKAVCEALGPVWIGACFKRAVRGQSAHYAGLALDMGQGQSAEQRAELRRFCMNSTLFSYVEPAFLTPTWVHAEISIAPSCAPGRGYPYLCLGDSGPHVFLLQELLCRKAFPCLLCGHFSENTHAALLRYQQCNGLNANGYVDAVVWSSLTA